MMDNNGGFSRALVVLAEPREYGLDQKSKAIEDGEWNKVWFLKFQTLVEEDILKLFWLMNRKLPLVFLQQ